MRLAFLALALLACACKGEEPTWAVVHERLPGALLSVWGTSATDVWTVGADARDGSGPLVFHYDGVAWERVPTGLATGTLWWVYGFAGGPIYMGGEGGVILRYDGSAFTVMTTPSTETVFGIWGAAPGDVWAVGGASDATGGFAWRLSGDSWIAEPTLPTEVPTMAAIWKVFGRGTDDAWLVGSNGVSLHWDGSALTLGDTGVGSSLFTVHANGARYTAVGGLSNGIVVENTDGAWHNVTPTPLPPGLAGVCLREDDSGVAVGTYGAVYARVDGAWQEQEVGFSLAQNLHAVWLDPSGDAWAVGGQTFTYPLTDGVMIHRGKTHPPGGP